MKPSRPMNNQSSTLLMISSIYTSLTKAEKKVADAVRNNPEEAMMATVTDLSEQAKVGETSVIRFCRRLGFRGYHEFKLAIAQDLVNLQSFPDSQIVESDDHQAIACKVTMKNEQMLKHTLDLINMLELKKAVSAMLAASKIYIYGVGSSGITALDLHYRLMRIGMNAEVHRDAHIIAMSASLARKDDLVFGITTSGSTRDLVDPLRQAKQNEATVITLTSHMRSPITNYADTVLLVPSKEMPLEGGALSTKIAQIHLLDILCTILMMEKDTARESIEKTAKAVADKLY
ncbi:MurR/RpiR family transcriptional regulator [Paenibacillus taihuensis]|nr:MurR/RpiR family transcriptional regulator [Paenibacillus taihuensis]